MAGLIVTCARHFEPDACDEIEKILADLGDESAYARATSMSGIITVETSLDPENAINDVRALIDDEPWVVRYLMRLIPITKWIESKQDQIVSNVLKMSKSFTTIVTGPGQNLSASFLCRESNRQNFARSSYELARTGSCFVASLPLILYTRFTALFLNGLHPIPYTVSVGKIITPPEFIAAHAAFTPSVLQV